MSANRENVQKTQSKRLSNLYKSNRKEKLGVSFNSKAIEIVERAASLAGISVERFVSIYAEKAASNILNEHKHLRLSENDQNLFVQLIENPPEPENALRDALNLYQEQVAGSE